MHDPRHILITGASSGIGAALALSYAAPGYNLSLHGRNQTRLDHIAHQARHKGAEVSIHCGDVTHADDLRAWIEDRDKTLPLDLVIANAGISAGTDSGRESADQAYTILRTNIDGVLHTVLPVLTTMEPRRRGQIALMSSLASFRGFAGAPAYCASKAAVRIYAEALRSEWAAKGIEINVVCPGFIKTPMTDVNDFTMPFLMRDDRAATLIRRGLIKNQARIAFPWPMYTLARILSNLPQPLIDLIATRLPKK